MTVKFLLPIPFCQTNTYCFMKNILLSLLLTYGMIVNPYPQNDPRESGCSAIATDKQMALVNECQPGSIIGSADNVLTFFTGNTEIPFVVFNDDIGIMGQSETRKVIKTNWDYRTYFGHNLPAEVNFATDWVVFYSAGSKPTGGYSVSIIKIEMSYSGSTLKVTTSLSKPGPGCMVTQAITKPYVLAKFRHPQPMPQYVQFYKDDKVRNCQ